MFRSEHEKRAMTSLIFNTVTYLGLGTRRVTLNDDVIDLKQYDVIKVWAQ